MINKILSMKVTWFDSITQTKQPNQETIGNILYGIYSGGEKGCLSSIITTVRAEHDNKKRRNIKCQLPVIMWQGLFSERSKKGLQSLSGIMCIDIDHKSDSEINRLQSTLRSILWVIAFFRSPSGDGLKILVKTNVSNTIDYENCYCQLIEYFQKELDCMVDESCYEYSKACYASYDPEIYVATHVEDFPYAYVPKYARVNDPKVSITDDTRNLHIVQPRTKSESFMNTLQSQVQGLSDVQIIEILDQRFSRYPNNYKDGYRTRSIFAQATTLCLAGVEQTLAIEYLKGKFLITGYDCRKLMHEAGNAYRKNQDRFGSERGQYKSYQDYVKILGL